MSYKYRANIETITLSFFICLFLFFAAWTLTDSSEPQQFAELAWSFVHGHMYLIDPIQCTDLVIRNGHIFWHLAPLPAVLLIPETLLLRGPFGQPLLAIVTNLLVFLLIYSLAWKKFNLNKITALWLAFMYLFASVYAISSFSSWSWYLSHGTATLLLLLALSEFFSERRYWLIGILLGLTFLTRFTAGLSVLFFILAIFNESHGLKPAIKKLIQLGLPIILAGLLLLGYNFARFNNPLDSGYTETDNQSIWVAKKHGLFNPMYIPTNIFYYFIASFQPVYDLQKPPAGQAFLLSAPFIKTTKQLSVSFFIASPIFILLFWSDVRNKYVKYALISSGIILLLLLTYYYPGYPQIGPRYMNDFLPLLLIPLFVYFKDNSLRFIHKAVIITSACLNLYIFLLTFSVIRI